MAKFSRDKGQRAERQVVALLQTVVNEAHEQAVGTWRQFMPKEHDWPLGESVQLKRNTLQSDRGGWDIAGLPYLAVEVKHQETLALAAWWKQTIAQAEPGQHPVLFYRKNNAPWRVRMFVEIPAVSVQGAIVPGSAWSAVGDIDPEPFCAWLRSLHTATLLDKAYRTAPPAKRGGKSR